MTKLIWIVILGLTLTAPSFAGNITISLASKHSDNKKDYNEINPGIGYQSNGDSYYTFGTYYNSFNHVSTYITKGYKRKWCGVEIGGVTGYAKEGAEEVIPAIVGVFFTPIGKFIAIPPPTKESPITIAWQLMFKTK